MLLTLAEYFFLEIFINDNPIVYMLIQSKGAFHLDA